MHDVKEKLKKLFQCALLVSWIAANNDIFLAITTHSLIIIF